MKLTALILFLLLLASPWNGFCAETSDPAPDSAAAPAAAPEPAVDTAPVAPVETPAPAQAATTEPAATTPAIADNLEFVSGEVSAADEAQKSLTVKLYGTDEKESAEKTLTVKVDENTDITDGEKDRDLKSLTAGTEVDVEYEPTSNKATYIFVY